MARKDVDDIIDKYEHKLEDEYGDGYVENFEPVLMNKDYEVFRSEVLESKVTNYERWCNVAENIIKVNPSEKDLPKLEESIRVAHLNVTPQSAASLGALCGILLIFFGLLLFGLGYALGMVFYFFPIFLLIAGAIVIKPIGNIPIYLANKWRLEASNQMVLCILYIVMYMRHTSNLEHAVRFAAEHVGPPLGLDLKKVFWDIETQRFFSIKESLDYYLESWREYNLEFVEAFHLIEGSLYEPNNERRIGLLEKSLEVMLDGTYNKMLHYAHNLKGPVTLLYMLGVILPILGLVIFPLVGSFLGGAIRWYHLALLYNIVLPIILISMGNNMLAKRPTGYGESEVLKTNPEFKIYEQWVVNDRLIPISPKAFGIFLALVIGFFGFLPLLMPLISPGYDFEIPGLGLFLDFKDGNGPYGVGSLIAGMLIPLGMTVGISTYYGIKTKRLIKIKKQVDDLEEEFSGAIFQLGNRIGDGIPSEMAFGEVAETMSGTPTGKFFTAVNRNIRKLGYGMKKAIFDPRVGAILLFPSNLIQSTMKVLVQSSNKSPQVVSTSLITISKYIDRIKQVNERLKDLLADILSSMISQINFLTPLIAGIVVGVGSMVTTIINKLGTAFETLGSGAGDSPTNIATLANILNVKDAIPGYFFQLVVGIYVLEITIILTILSTSIERGADVTTTRNRIGKNVKRSMTFYFIVSLIGVILFNLLANAVSFVPSP
ncbi:MAG: hypothetical protein Q8Q42_04545 [Nanoarchaeota archaeon]|nr:hypothetical protein [Nanoarchaeota archaeon]